MTSLSSSRVTTAKYERHKSASRASKQRDPLVTCVELDYIEELETILKTNGRHFTQEKLDSTLLRAAATGKVTACELLVKSGGDPNALESITDHNTRYSVTNNSFIPEHGKRETWLRDHSSVGGSPLHRAVENMHLNTVSCLIQLGADVNIRDRDGLTPLMLACMKRSGWKMVDLLTLIPGCDVMAKDYVTKRTAFHFAAEVGDAVSVKLLLEAGTLVEEQDFEGNTALMLVFTIPLYENPAWPPRQTNECCRLLLEYGSFVNAQNNNDKRPIDFAVDARMKDGVDFLLQNNALVSKAVLSKACIQVSDECIVELLLHKAHTFEDEFLCALLLVMISSVSSKWAFNSRDEEYNSHQIAKCIIKAVSDPASYGSIRTHSDHQLSNFFGNSDSFSKVVHKNDLTNLRSYGIIGYSILMGKYSVAKMLYEAGCRDQLSKFRECKQLWSLACGKHYLKNWLPAAIHKSVKDALKQGFDDESDELDVYLPNVDLDKAFDNVEPYDEALRESGHNMLDVNYIAREKSKAFLATNVFIYAK